MAYTPVRDEAGAIAGVADKAGRVLFDTRALDDSPPSPPPPPPAPVPPVPAAPASASRPMGDAPTPFGQHLTARPAGAASAPPQAPAWMQVAGGVALALIFILAIGVALRDLPAPRQPPAATAAPTEGAPPPPPADAPAGVPLPLAAVAYDSPGGNSIDALEPGRRCAMVQRPNLDWVQLDCQAAGLVWVRAEKLVGLEDQLPPIPSPTPAPPTATPRPAPVYQAPVYVPPAPPPLTCAEIVVQGTSYGQHCAATRAELLATNEALVNAYP